MQERRKVKRRYLLFYSRVFNAVTLDLIGHLVDITSGGAMLISEEPINLNTIYELRLELTKEVSDKPYLDFSVKSMWGRPDIDPHYYDTGFQFINTSLADDQTIQKIIEVYGFRDN